MRYRERLWPAWWVFLASALLIPATLAVFLPISQFAGVIAASVLYGVVLVALLVSAPRIEVTDETLHVGRARIERTFLGDVTSYTGSDAFAERGPRLDARAHLALRGGISGLVKVNIKDAEDPTPYWLVSTRHPAALTRVLTDTSAPRTTPESATG